MKIGEALSKMDLLGYTGLDTIDKAEARANSFRNAGIVDGDDLQTAYDRWEQSPKKNNRSPRADEFKVFMPERLLDSPRVYHFDWPAYRERYADSLEWTWKKLVELHGNPQAVGEVIDGVQMSAWFADENKWLRRFEPEKKCSRYVKLKLRHEDGFGGSEALDAAKAAILPTLDDVQKARKDAA